MWTMAKKSSPQKKAIEQYDHKGTCRLNNPPAGLVSAETEPEYDTKTYSYDPHLDPQLQWAGKAEHTSFEVPTVSLHVHERIDSRTIIRAAKGSNGDRRQASLFEFSIENPPLREAVEFYRHKHNWSNRLVAGDSLLVMNSLLEKEGMAGKVQMIYIDPPYGIKYGSNFQPFVNRRDVKDRRDEDLTSEPEMIKAFRDTWELGIHSYLAYLRDRLLLARELLTEGGSVFVQISDENVHHVREIMDEVFGSRNFVSIIYFATTGGFATTSLSRIGDYLIWYGKDRNLLKYHQLYAEKGLREGGGWSHSRAEFEDGRRENIGVDEVRRLLDEGRKIRPYSLDGLTSQGTSKESSEPFEFRGRIYNLPHNSHWKTSSEGMKQLIRAERIEASTNSIRYVRFIDDFSVKPLTNIWDDTNRPGYIDEKKYVVQTSTKVIERCLLMTTDPGDLVLDPTCGSGTTAYVAEKWGRRWITCDTSRVAITLAKQRLMTAVFDYYDLAHPEEGVGSGFVYKTIPHITLKSIANNPAIDDIYEKHRLKVEAALADINAAAKTSCEEWDVPFDPDPAWPEAAEKAHKKFLSVRQKRQTEIDASIQKNAPQETLYDQPQADKTKVRVTGPFTVEAVPAPTVEPLTGDTPAVLPADDSAARTGESLRQDEWRTELLAAGIRGRSGQRIAFARLETLGGTRWLHARGETKDDAPKQVTVSFGPEHAALNARQVEMALKEAQRLVPRPEILVFAAFQFDPEAAKDIDETNWPGVTLLKAQMNTDLQTDDLKKKCSRNESFWLIGQPDITLNLITEGPEAGTILLSVNGFDYYDTRKGTVDGGGPDKIAMWMLDTDYDGRSLFPRQVFFPMAGKDDGWAKLKKSLKAEIDEEKIEAYRGTVSLPFKPGEKRRIAVKIVDDRGIESIIERDLDNLEA
ncbi:MAG: Putative DNA methylase [Methanoculleus marisnigri]|uniref:Putative DNA methylase n=1 Tax=Methanoculleus marisnigri TaxID=2198 RepID=A0A101GSJ8_9EURY|nr:MAG: Putative DNA methylase [Methanoculleus marisnigri]